LKPLYKTILNIFVALLFILAPACSYNGENEHYSSNICEEYEWHDVVTLVQPYLNETLYAALIMQGQSSEYHPSAASHVMDKSLPKDVQNILNLLIAAKC
jgi:hypothetical protein